MGDIANDTGAGLDIRHLTSGTDVIAVFPSGTFFSTPNNNLTLYQRAINISSGTSVQVIPGGAGSTFNVWSYELVVSSDCIISWLNGGSALTGSQAFAANGGIVTTIQPPYWLLKGYAGSDINIAINAGSAGGRLNYFIT